MSWLATAIWTPLSLGADSAVAGAAVGPFLRTTSGRLVFAAALGICDGAATAIGAATGWQVGEWLSTWSVIVVSCVYAGYLVGVGSLARHVARRVHRQPAVRRSRATVAAWPVLLLPPLLGIDNLAYGAARGHLDAHMATLAIGLTVTSSLLALLGTAVGQIIVRASRRSGPSTSGVMWWAGLGLLVTAVVSTVS